MTPRRFLFLSHRYCGLALALFLLVAGATGCLLVFRDGLDALLNPDLFDVAPRPALAATALADRMARSHPAWRIAGFDLASRPGTSLRMTVDIPGSGPAEAFVDPGDGRVVGLRRMAPGPDRRHVIEAVFRLHYTLLAGTPGRWLMGVVALCWLALNLVGLCLTWPRRRPLLASWRSSFRTSRRALRGRPMPEVHRVSGLWLLPFLTVLAYSSVAMNLYDELFRPIVERLSPPRAGSPFDRPAPGAPPPGPVIGYGAAIWLARQAAVRDSPGLQPVALVDDAARDLYGTAFAPGGTRLYEGFGRVTYYVDRHDGRLVWIDRPRLDGAGRLVLRALYPLHSGQIAGLPTRLLVLLLGLVTCGLAVTGFLPWWRRWRARFRSGAPAP